MFNNHFLLITCYAINNKPIEAYFLKKQWLHGYVQAHVFAMLWHNKPANDYIEGLYHSETILQTINQTINAVKLVHIAKSFMRDYITNAKWSAKDLFIQVTGPHGHLS